MTYFSLEITYSLSSRTLFERFLDFENPVLLLSDSNGLSYRQNRWDVIAANPVCVIEQNFSGIPIEKSTHQSYQEISSALREYCSPIASDRVPFISGAIGLAGYAAGEHYMDVASNRPALPENPKTPHWPDLLVGIYQWAIVSDHLTKKRWLVGDPKLDRELWQQLVNYLGDVVINQENHLNQSYQVTGKSDSTPAFKLTTEWKQSFNQQSYQKTFDQIIDHILCGDCYQVNLTQQFSASYYGNVWQAVQQAWDASAAPFACYFSHGGSAIASCSPECFIQVENGLAITRPIKGTQKRGLSIDEDADNARKLRQSGKDIAENLMIVDLMRNDLGRYCHTGSIKTPGLFDVESFTNVHHLVSTITGEIEPNNASKSLELFLGCLPGGSITGAPKKRAMEIIAELEPHYRSIYCGSMFYLGGNGNLNSNIMIRSLLFENDDLNTGTVYCWGGGGIVADSDPQAEYAEANLKVQNLLTALSGRPQS